MNWTGGRLQRHSNSNTVAHRQKQHFARIRTRLRHRDTGSSHFQPGFLQPGEAEHETLDWVLVPGGRSPGKRQKALDQDETVAPLVQRLTSMKPRPPTHRHISGRSIHDSSNTTSHPSVSPCEGDLTLSPQAVVVSHGKANNGRKPHVQREHAKRQKGCEERHASDDALTNDVVQRERDRLLARRDWAGLAPSQPMHMRFSASKERETIGKRHKTFRNRTRSVVRDGASRTPFLERADAELGGPWMSGALLNNNEDIDIRIGTDALATQPSARGNDSHEPAHRLTPCDSDPMLFDLEDAVQELQPIRAREYLTAGSYTLEQVKEETQNSANLPDTGTASRKGDGGTEAEPVEDIERLLQELDGCSYRDPAAPASTVAAVLAAGSDRHADSEDDLQKGTQVSDVHDQSLMRFPTSLQELESGREGIGLGQAETRGQAKGHPELQSSPPKPCRRLFRSTPSGSSFQGPELRSARASSESRSENPFELLQRPGTAVEGFDDVRWWEVQSIASGRTDQSPGPRRTGSGRRIPLHSPGEDAPSSTAFCDSSADPDARPGLSAERPIGDNAGHRDSGRRQWVEQSQPTDRSPNSTFLTERATANTFRPSCSTALHPQASESVPDIPSAGSRSGSHRQITAPVGKAPAAATQGWIGDADHGDEAETVWKRFVFGDDDEATIDSPEEERESLEPAIRSTLGPGWRAESSLFVEAPDNSAAAGTAAPSPACAHLHSVGFRYGAADTADASAGRAVSSGEEQASESIAFVEVGSTRAAASPMDSRCLPARAHDADAQANQASDDANTVAATAGESPDELASLDRRERIIFTKPKVFVGSMAAIARLAAGGAAAEGNASKGTTLHTGPAGTDSKISNPRKRRRGRLTAGFSPSVSGLPSGGDTGYASDLIEQIEDY